MVVKLIFILGYLALTHFLVDELILAMKWKRLVKYPQHYGFTDEEFDAIIERDKNDVAKNKRIETRYWDKSLFNEFKMAKKLGFIRIPVNIHIDILGEDYGPGGRMMDQGRIFTAESSGVGWKTKWGTPRFENNPYMRFTFFAKYTIVFVWSFRWTFGTPREERMDNDQYWEQVIWCGVYRDMDLEKGRDTWEWVTDRGGVDVSTWDDKYLRKKYRKK